MLTSCLELMDGRGLLTDLQSNPQEAGGILLVSKIVGRSRDLCAVRRSNPDPETSSVDAKQDTPGQDTWTGSLVTESSPHDSRTKTSDQGCLP